MGSSLKILALDPATKCGFAHSCGVAGTWDLSVRRDESAGMRLVRLRGKLGELQRDVGVDLVVFEAARHASARMGGAVVVQAELQSVIKVWCHDVGLDYRGYSPSEVKKHATGKGNADKKAVIAVARKRWPGLSREVDDNEVDARWLLDLAVRDLGGTER